MILYRSLDTIPIFNFIKLSNTGDLRYLIKDVDIDNLPEITNFAEFKEAYEAIFISNENIDLTTSYLYGECLRRYFIFKFGGSENDVNNSFRKYLEHLNDRFKNFQFNEQTFETAYNLNDYIKIFIPEYFDRIYKRLDIFDYKKIQCVSRNKINLYEQMAIIAKELHIEVNEYKCSVNKFNAYLKLVKEILDRKNEAQNGRKN